MELYHYEPVGLSESALAKSGSDKDEDEADWRLGNTRCYALVASHVCSVQCVLKLKWLHIRQEQSMWSVWFHNVNLKYTQCAHTYTHAHTP